MPNCTVLGTVLMDDLEDFEGNLTALNLDRDPNQVQAILVLMKNEIEYAL